MVRRYVVSVKHDEMIRAAIEGVVRLLHAVVIERLLPGVAPVDVVVAQGMILRPGEVVEKRHESAIGGFRPAEIAEVDNEIDLPLRHRFDKGGKPRIRVGHDVFVNVRGDAEGHFPRCRAHGSGKTRKHRGPEG